ncbi:MAG: phage terminase large subunit [Clostridia bacterium]|nr:phage terminase large subunit [Clostridia bacterium]
MSRYAEFDVKQVKYLSGAMYGAWLNVAEGGKRAGKNILNAIAWSLCLEEHPDKLHLAAGVSISAAKMNILDANGFGLMSLFAGRCQLKKYMGREALYIHTRTGEKIVLLAGGRRSNDAAMIKGHSYGTAYITEVNECHQTFFQEVMDRTLASSKRQLFLDLNPKTPRHWFYHDFLDFQQEKAERGENPGFNYAHLTAENNLSLSPEQLKRELSKYNKASVWYKADILGLRTAASGRIYVSFSGREAGMELREMEKRRFTEFSVGVDLGGTDATAAVLVGFTEGYREVLVLDGVYHRQGMDERMSESAYAGIIARWLGTWGRRLRQPISVYVDSAAKLFRTGLKNALQEHGIQNVSVKGTDKRDGINARIELTEQLLAENRLRIASHLSPWMEAFENATWDVHGYEKGEWVRLDDGSYPVDCLDALEYAIYPFRRYLEDTDTYGGRQWTDI